MIDAEAKEACRIFNKAHSTTWIEPVDEHERELLEQFCKLVEDLEGYAIFKNLLHRGKVECSIKIQDEAVLTAIKDLDEEHLRSFLSTLRMLYQPQDGCSVRQIAPIFEKRVGQRNSLWWNGFDPVRRGLNSFLDMRLGIEETNREIFETFLYCDYSHKGHPQKDRQRRMLYKEWQQDQASYVERKTYFLVIVATLFAYVCDLCPLVRRLLAAKVAVE